MQRKNRKEMGLPGYRIINENPTMQLSQIYGWGQNLLNLKDLHDKGFTGKGIKIAVLDTGVDDFHEDLKGQVKTLEDFTGEGYPKDRARWGGHGTGVAGVIAAKDNAVGTIGWAYDSEIYGLKCLTEAGSGDLRWIIDAVERADELDVDIINLSLGASVTVPALTAAFEKFINKRPGRYVVAATGNGGRRDPVNYPAAETTVWGVGSLATNGYISSFSSTATEGTDLIMPGENILTTWKDGSYVAVTGTSFAAPAFSGLLGCYLQGKYTVTRDDVLQTGRKASGRGPYTYPQLIPLLDKIRPEEEVVVDDPFTELIDLINSNRDAELLKIEEIRGKVTIKEQPT